MPLRTNSPTSSKAALVGPPLPCFLVSGLFTVPCYSPQRLCPGSWHGLGKVVAPSRGAAGDCQGAPARGEGGEPRRARRSRDKGVLLSGKAEIQVFQRPSGYQWGFYYFLKKAHWILNFIIGW